jgi:hypothetical protein
LNHRDFRRKHAGTTKGVFSSILAALRGKGGAMSFVDAWVYIEGKLNPGQVIKLWNIEEGDLDGEFIVQSVTPNTIFIDTTGNDDIKRISRRDVESVYLIWSRYQDGEYATERIRGKVTDFADYVISILHWTEASRGGTLP